MDVPVVTADDEYTGLDNGTGVAVAAPADAVGRVVAPMTYALVLLRHGESDWNAKNLFTGWVDVDLTDKGRGGGVRGGELLARGRPAARRRAHLAAAPRDHAPPTSRSTPPTGTGSRYAARGGSTSATTARCRARTRSRRWRSTARSSSCSGAAPSTCPPPPIDDDDEFSQVGDPRYADLGAEMPRTECLKDVIARMLPYWDVRHRRRPARGPARAGRRARQQPARAGQAPRRHQRRRHRRRSTSPPGMPLVYRLDDDLQPDRRAAASTSTPRPPPPPPRPSPTRAAEPVTATAAVEPVRMLEVPSGRHDARRRRGDTGTAVTTKTTRLPTETAWSAIRS